MFVCLISFISAINRPTISETKTGTCGENVNFVFDTETGALTLSGTGDTSNYRIFENPPWYEYRENVKTVKIEEGITGLGSYIFKDLSKAEFSDLPSTLTSIREGAFSSCSAMKSITIPSTVEVIGEFAFYSCEGLTKVTLSSGLKTIESCAFLACKSLDDLTVPNSAQTIQDSAFKDCTNLKKIVLPEGITTIGKFAFMNADLSKTTLPKSLIEIKSGAFWNTKITEIEIDGEEPTVIGEQAFCQCTYLVSLTFSRSIDSIGIQAFTKCSKLTSLSFEDDVQSIGDQAFTYCSALKQLVFRGDVGTIGSKAFYECKSLEVVYSITSIVEIKDSAFEHCKSLKLVEISSVDTIGPYAFSNCESLVKVTFDEVNSSIGIGAFSFCGSLQIFEVKTELAGEIGNSAFESCTKLIEIRSHINLERIGARAFYGCTSLIQFLYGPVDYVGDMAFKDCKNLVSFGADVSGGVGTSAFENCVRLEKMPPFLLLPRIEQRAFANCESLSSFYLRENTLVEAQAFYNCKKLEIVFANMKNDQNIHKTSFQGCTSLQTVDVIEGYPGKTFAGIDVRVSYIFPHNLIATVFMLSNDVTKLIVSAFNLQSPQFIIPVNEIRILGNIYVVTGLNVFNEYKDLEKVTIESNLYGVESGFFKDCPKLSKVVYNGNVNPEGGEGAFSGCPLLKTIEVPSDYTEKTFLGKEVTRAATPTPNPQTSTSEPDASTSTSEPATSGAYAIKISRILLYLLLFVSGVTALMS